MLVDGHPAGGRRSLGKDKRGGQIHSAPILGAVQWQALHAQHARYTGPAQVHVQNADLGKGKGMAA